MSWRRTRSGRGPRPFGPFLSWSANAEPWPPKQRRQQRGLPARPPWAWRAPVWHHGPSSALGTLDRIRPASLVLPARSLAGVGRRTSDLILVAAADPQCPGSLGLIATLRHEIHVV